MTFVPELTFGRFTSGVVSEPPAASYRTILADVSGFDPATLFVGGIQGGWWDPSDFTSMFQDTAGTVPITAAGQVVARINDKSGNNNHLLQATAGNRPTIQQDGNGLFYLDYDGTADLMAAVGPGALAQPNEAIFAVFFDTLGFIRHIYDGIGASARNAILFQSDGTPQLYAGAVVTAGAVISATTLYVIEGLFNGASSVMRINGTAGSTVNPGAQALDGIRIGGFDAGAAPFDGRWYGGLVRNAEFDATQRTNITNYMKAKCGASF